MKRTKKLLSFFLAIMMVITTIPAFTLTTNAASETTRTVTVSNWAVLSTGGRTDNDKKFEIVNDGQNGNFSIGIVKFNKSNLTGTVTKALYTIKHYAYTTRSDNMYIGFYYPTANLNTFTMPSSNGGVITDGTAKTTIFTNANQTNHIHANVARSHFAMQEIDMVYSKKDAITYTYNVDVAPILNYAMQNNTDAYLMIMLDGFDGSTDNDPWSDREVTVSTGSFNATCTTFDSEVSSTTLSPSATGYAMGNGSARDQRVKNNNKFNLCNDGASNNFGFAYMKFNLSSISGETITTATLNATLDYSGCNGSKGVNFYAIDPKYTMNYSSTGAVESSFTSGGNNAVKKVLTDYSDKTPNYSDRIPIGTVRYSTTTVSLEMRDVIKKAIAKGWSELVIIAVPEYNFGRISDGSWSDAWLVPSAARIVATYENPTIYTDADLKALMTTYETRMSDSKLYNNMGAAYNAYVAASKAYDSYHYGLKTDINLTSYYTNLQNALYSMTEYTMSITQKTPGGFNGDSTSYNYTLGNTHQNVLYSPKVNFTDGTDEYLNTDGRGGAKSEIRIAYPTTVLFYDDVKTPKFPIHAYIKRTDYGVIYVRNIYPALETATVSSNADTYITRSSNFQFEQKWKGQSNSSGYGRDFLTPWFGSSNGSIEVTGIAGNYLLTGYSETWDGKWDPKWARAANVLSYKGTPTEAMNVYSLKWYKCSNEKDNTTNLYSTVFEPAGSKVYVLNYKGIKTLLTNKKALVSDISYFKENRNSTVSNLLSSFDNLAVDFNGLTYSSPDTVRSDLNSRYNTLNGRTATADDQKGYPAIRAAIDTPKQIPALVEVGDSSTYSVYELLSNDNANGKFTTSSYSTFKEKYNEVKNYMANVVTDGYTGGYTDVAANALNRAIESLQVVADFTTITENYTEASNILNTYDSSSYTTSTWNALVNAKNNATFATYTDTEKKNTSRTTNQGTIDSQANALRNAIDNLAEKADFGSYNNALTNATDNVLPAFKNQKYDRLPIFDSLKAFNDIHLYSPEEQADTPESDQSIVTRNANKLIAANNSVYEYYDYNHLVDQSALKAFIDKNFDLDVVDNSNLTDQKKSANGLYKYVDFNGNRYWSLDVRDQAELNSNIAEYINNINSTLGEYDIKVPEGISVAVSGLPQTPKSTSTIDNITTHTYTLTYGVPVTFTSENEDTAWYMEYQSNVAKRGVQYQCSGLTYSTKVMGNMTVTPKARVNDTTPNKVTVVRQYSDGSSSAMLIDYVNGSYVLPTAQTYPNYVFAGYEVNGTEYNAGATVTITGDTVIYANYTADGGDHQIKITYTNGTTTDSTYKYNSAVKLNDPNAYAWIEKPIGSDKWRPSYIGTGCSYKVTEPMELMAVATEDKMKEYCGTKEAYAPNLRYNGPLVANDMGVVFHGQFINYVPAGAEIVEYGVAVNVNNANSFDLINTNGKVIRCKSTNPMKSNQFSVGARYNGNTFTNSTTISYRSYMIYQITVNGQLETKYVYSDVRHFPENA